MSEYAAETRTQEHPEAAPILRLTYRSHSLLPAVGAGAPPDALADILRVSRTNNEEAGVTGALVLHDDWFAQVLEGPDPTVRTFYARICADRRHDALELDATVAADARLFGRWAMALVAEHHQPDTPLVATSGGLG